MKSLAIVGAIATGIALVALGAGGAWWLSGPQQATPEDVATDVAGGAAAAPSSAPAAQSVDLELLRQLLVLTNPQQRQEVLGSNERFEQFVRGEAANQAVLAAAQANDADQPEVVKVLMRRAAQKVLVELYLNQVVRQNLDPEFPSADDVRQAYERNKETFRLPDRMHLWQIFIPAPESADDAAVDQARAAARTVVADIRAGKTDFSTAAKEFSQHAESRLSDGYMGLLNTAALIPEVREAVADLEVNAISDPVRTATGFHVVKRGETVTGDVPTFDEAAPRVTRLLRQQAAQRVRGAAIEKIIAEFPVTVDAGSLELWRVDLATTDWNAVLAGQPVAP